MAFTQTSTQTNTLNVFFYYNRKQTDHSALFATNSFNDRYKKDFLNLSKKEDYNGLSKCNGNSLRTLQYFKDNYAKVLDIFIFPVLRQYIEETAKIYIAWRSPGVPISYTPPLVTVP
ncbi:uncharacterized protein LOC116174740 [Photinus pyralis]|uniref:uncharacterized protein LOC116174740 n=1 Tax=Photinus pyralis TaxID=7054 RepID=UPI001266E5E2|nr:uncharacterized protein LOC116174740 [Photinus pyralis]